jgi:iron complex outermembrane receptor protein
LSFKKDSAGSLDLPGFPGIEQAGSDPRHQMSLRSSMKLAPDVTLDFDLRYVGARPDPEVDSYHDLNARLGWNVSKSWTLALAGFNLLHAQHQEYTEPSSDAIKRSVSLSSRWRF